MEPYIERAMQRLPILLETGIRQFFCGPESFTPDHNYLMGRAPYIDKLFVACGFNSLGILSGGGAGHVMAQWINDGIQPMDIWDVDVRRIQPSHNNKNFVVARTYESLGIGYQMHWPNRQWETARNVKQSVLHYCVKAAGACFGESAGWERPNWYARPGQAPVYEYNFGRQNWLRTMPPNIARCAKVGLFEQSSFGKILVQGRDAERVLNHIATADMSVPIGRVVYTNFVNQRGGVEADITISRLAEDKYLILTPAFTCTHIKAWLHDHTPSDACCVVTDMSSAWAMLNLQGPASRALLSALSSTNFDNAAFPYGTWQNIEIGFQNALCMRLSYSGELGYELYIPTEMALPVYDQVVAKGADFGLAHCGYHTLNTLRAEKAFRERAHDMGPIDSLLDAGLGFTCAWNKAGGFIGRDALLAQREAGPLKRRLVQFLLDDPEPVLVHNEPILRDGARVGQTTSAGYGHTLGASVAMGYLECEDGVTPDYVAAGSYRIEQANRVYSARASLTPMYDPKNVRLMG